MKDDRNLIGKQLKIGLFDSQIWQRYVALNRHDLMQGARIAFLDLIEYLEKRERERKIQIN